MYARKNAPTTEPSVPREVLSQQEHRALSSSSDWYQKILDYHVVEILLTTIIFCVIMLVRQHR